MVTCVSSVVPPVRAREGPPLLVMRVLRREMLACRADMAV